MGEKKGALFLIIVVIIIASIFIYAVNLYYPALLSDIFSGASDLVDTGFNTMKSSADPSKAAGWD